MPLFSVLKDDHRKVKALFNRLESTTERGKKTRHELFMRLKTALLPHAKAEEATLYARLKQSSASKELALAAAEEHAIADRLMSELEALDPSDERWGAKLKVLKESVEHHIKEEESALFQAARRELDQGEQQQILEHFEEMKAEMMESLEARKARTGRRRSMARLFEGARLS